MRNTHRNAIYVNISDDKKISLLESHDILNVAYHVSNNMRNRFITAIAIASSDDTINIAAGRYLGGKNVSVNIPEDFTIIKDPSNI